MSEPKANRGSKVSLVVWRDPKSDPPPLVRTGKTGSDKRYWSERVLYMQPDGSVDIGPRFEDGENEAYGGSFYGAVPCDRMKALAWAELPAPGEATTEDYLDALQWARDLLTFHVEAGADLSESEVAAVRDELDRLRGLLSEE